MVGAMSHVRIDRTGPVWRLVLDRPPANAIDLEVARDLAAAFADADRSSDCRAFVLTGTGRFFSAGIDVKAVPAYDGAARAAMLRTINSTAAGLYGVAKPVVAAVNGHALGGALVVALACDVRLAAAGDARIGLTEAAAGIPFPAVPLLVVEAEVTSREARLATLVGEAVGPERALALGFVDAVVPPGELLARAHERAAALLAIPGFAAVKAQLRGRALAAMRAVVASDAEPLLARWI